MATARLRRVLIDDGSREVEPGQNSHGKRGAGARAKRKAQRAAVARALRLELDEAAAERQGAWADTEVAHPNLTYKTTKALDELHGKKRKLRRQVYRQAPELEGQDVRRDPARRVAR